MFLKNIRPVRKFSTWKSSERGEFAVSPYNGFLPRSDPLIHLPRRFSALEEILDRMPLQLPNGNKGLLYTGQLAEAVEQLPMHTVSGIGAPRVLAALFRDYTFLASAYLLEPSDLERRRTGTMGLGRTVLPANIAVPLTTVAAKMGIRPYMEYAHSYALYNYQRKDSEKPLTFDNMELIRKFSGCESEKGFILTHVAMVAHSRHMVGQVIRFLNGIHAGDVGTCRTELAGLHNTIKVINREMETMWKRSLPGDYAAFRTFIMGTKDAKLFPHGVIYEGLSKSPMYFRGESGANDTMIPTLDNLCQLTDMMPENPLTDILKDFRTYRPPDHNRWLTWVEKSARELQVREFCRNDVELLTSLVGVMDQIREFRWRHWEFTKAYIIKYSNHPVATGGSPIVMWLPNQLTVVLEAIVADAKHLAQMEGTSSEARKIAEIAQEQLDTLRSDIHRLQEMLS